MPKQYHRVAGKMLLRHTIDRFISLPELSSIQVIIDPAYQDMYAEAIRGLPTALLRPAVAGSDTRQQSVARGLAAYSASEKNDFVFIHDAARPFITQADIYQVLSALKIHSAVTLCSAVTDTLVMENVDLPRDHITAIQTPQAFKIGDILSAHQQAGLTSEPFAFTDDTALIRAMGKPVHQVRGSSRNFKITTSEDLIMAEHLLSAATETRTGMGFDVHAFDPAPATHIRLGGIDIPHPRKLLGHSDADVVLHALTDAVLGTISQGDIGTHFLPSDPRWKNADSQIFLQHALSLLRDHHGTFLHADITLMCELPKIGPHRTQMQTKIAEIMGVETSRISIKATTTEGLGFTGRKEGIAAQAIVTVKINV